MNVRTKWPDISWGKDIPIEFGFQKVAQLFRVGIGVNEFFFNGFSYVFM